MEWFDRSYVHFPFKMYSGSHLTIMTIFILVSIGIYLIRDKLNDTIWRKVEVGTALSLIVVEGTYHVWMFENGIWNVSHSIPLELCSISVLLSIVLLITRKSIILEILFFTALLGSTQAIFFPSLHYDFPHFRFFHFFYTHLMVVWVALYFTWIQGFRPTIRSVLKLFVFLNILMPIMLFINKFTQGNYLYLSHKPKHTSLLDILGPYPWYIVSMDVLSLILSFLVWLLFREKASSVIDKKLSHEKSIGGV
ncbi:YwaF family protein [Neobacillus sp. LXY-4]|uniref:YwaF family protein n=1 Tax=Neobacillus sp. LXY-4 TaxID=3379826 RepID=UPI003EE302EF